MKILWVLACVLTALDMMNLAVGLRDSVLVAPEYQWAAWFAVVGWLSAAFTAARADARWL